MRSPIQKPMRSPVLLLTALLLFSAPALAGDFVEGGGRLLARNLSTSTLEIEDDLRIQVLSTTRIYDGDQKPIFFWQIPDPATGAPVHVEYKGTQSGMTIQATRLVVAIQPN